MEASPSTTFTSRALLLMVLVLFLLVTSSRAARPSPVLHVSSPAESRHGVGYFLNFLTRSCVVHIDTLVGLILLCFWGWKVIEAEEIGMEETCEGAEEEGECLMRRTLAAHVDYIYTQKQKN